MKEPLDEKDLPPWVTNALQAFRKAVKTAVNEHWRQGRPVYIWRDERVMALYPDGTCIPAEEVPEDPPAADLRSRP